MANSDEDIKQTDKRMRYLITKLNRFVSLATKNYINNRKGSLDADLRIMERTIKEINKLRGNDTEDIQSKIDILVEGGELIKHEEPEHGAIMYEDMGGHVFGEDFAEDIVRDLLKENGEKYFKE